MDFTDFGIMGSFDDGWKWRDGATADSSRHLALFGRKKVTMKATAKEMIKLVQSWHSERRSPTAMVGIY